MAQDGLEWIKVARAEEDLPEGRVMTVRARTVSLCLPHLGGQWAAMDNRCPHLGGPIGEGCTERGVEGECWIRRPLRGRDFDTLTCAPTGGHEDAGQTPCPVEVRDGEVFVGIEPETKAPHGASDVMAEAFVAWGVKRVFGMIGHSSLGLADALRRRETAGDLAHVGIRHEGVRNGRTRRRAVRGARRGPAVHNRDDHGPGIGPSRASGGRSRFRPVQSREFP